MSSDPWAGPILIQLVLLVLSAWLSAAETAILSFSDAKIRHDAEQGDKKAALLVKMLDQPDRFVFTARLCMLLAGFLSAAFGVLDFAPRLARTFTSWGVQMDVEALQVLCAVLVTLLLALLTQVLGRAVPRRIALQRPEKTARVTAGVLHGLSIVLWPLVWLMEKTACGILRLLGIDPNAQREEVTEEEIRAMVDIGGESGAIEENEKEMIENIFEFNNRSAEDVMTHRIDVTSIWVGDDHDAIVKTILDTGLSRFPVYDEDIDDIIGILNTRDFLLEAHHEHPRSVRELLREAYFVPETVQADMLFRDMQTRKVHMAIVVDEYGGMSGIVTMEDLLEEIVGNIYDEFDPQAKTEIAQVDEGVWRISGSAPLEDVAEALDVELPLEEDYDTLGGLIFNQFTTIPSDGATPELDVAGLHIKVEILADHRVESALVSKLPPEGDAEDVQEKHEEKATADDKNEQV